MLRLKLLVGSLCLIQVYGPNASVLHPEFVEGISDAVRKVKTNEATFLSRNFNAHVENNIEIWKDVIGRCGGAEINNHVGLLLQLCCYNALCIMNSSSNKEMCAGTPGAEIHWVNGHSIDFYIVSADGFR